LGATYFPVFTCRSLRSDLFILVLSLLGFSVPVVAFQSLTSKHCLQILGQRMLSEIDFLSEMIC